jgi:alanine dehydrogenase
MLAARPGGMGAGSFEEVVIGADVVCCCTDARQPVIRAAWLALGTHLSSGSFGPELDAETARAGRSSSTGAA